VKGAPVIGCPQRGDWFAAKHGGYIEAGIDAALTAVAALDGKRKLIVAWTPDKSMLSNANIPCIHADPYFGTIPPCEAREARGLYLFTTDSLAQLRQELRRSGLGRAGGVARQKHAGGGAQKSLDKPAARCYHTLKAGAKTVLHLLTHV